MKNQIEISTSQFKSLIESGAIAIVPSRKKYRIKSVLHQKLVEYMEARVGVKITNDTLKTHMRAFVKWLKKGIIHLAKQKIGVDAAQWVIKNWFMFIFFVKENGRIPSIQSKTQKVYNFA